MLVFPNAKINLGLNILSKRPDGYHELETCFYPVLWRDILEVVPSGAQFMSSSGINIPGAGTNIIEKAYQVLNQDFQLPKVSMHLHKVIPIGAGLGGGSADAAFALKLFNDMFGLGLDDQKLMDYAVQIGADCAFFIKNKPMLARGIGEKLSDIDLSLQDKFIVMVYPNIHISTKEAYANIISKVPERSIEYILSEVPIAEWRSQLTNDFEQSLFKNYPILPQLKQTFYDHGAVYAAMSGSGSCMFGIFDEMPEIEFDSNFQVWSGKL